jgi:hypothetical protein
LNLSPRIHHAQAPLTQGAKNAQIKIEYGRISLGDVENFALYVTDDPQVNLLQVLENLVKEKLIASLYSPS